MSTRRTARPRSLPGLIGDSALMLSTTIVMAVAGSLFWLIAARVQPTESIGVAASLITGVVVLSLLAQLGLNVTLIKVLPSSSNPRADIAWAVAGTASAGTLLGLLYAVIVPEVSVELQVVRSSVWHVVSFALLVGGTAANVTSDAAFLALRKLNVNLVINGVMMSLFKCGLPLLLISMGPFGLVVSIGVASLLAAFASVATLLISVRTPDGPARRSTRRPSPELTGSLRFAGAGYVASVIDLVPTLVLPLIVITTLGSTTAGVYFVSFQIAGLLNAAAFAIGGSMFAAGSRNPQALSDTLRRSAVLMGAAMTAGAAILVLVAPYLLGVFGSYYSTNGTATLRVLAIGSVVIGVHYWSVNVQRLNKRLWAMIAIPAATSSAIVLLALVWAPHGAPAVAAAWAVGYAIGAAVGLTLAFRQRTRSRPARRVRPRGGRHRRGLASRTLSAVPERRKVAISA